MKVIIVGVGLVGSLSACYFGKRGHEVHVYEYRKDLRSGGERERRGRSINLALSRRGLTALAELSLEKEVLSTAIPMEGRMIHPIEGRNRSIPYDPVYGQCIYSVGRKCLNEILLSEAESHPNVHMHFNHKIISIHLEEGRIVFQRLNSPEGKMAIGEDGGDLLIGADGAFSAVRREMLKKSLFSFSQTYIDHGYVELAIPQENNYLMEKNHLHIWPRGEFMLIALPNQDQSWTLTLFMPLEKFSEILEANGVVKLFKEYFPDALRFIGEQDLEEQFSAGASTLVSIKCSKYHHKGKVVIIGDAAHAMVPFYGQGMNAFPVKGFEDCRILDDIIHDRGFPLEEALAHYSETRRENATAICDLAMYNYVEMRDLVNKPSYLFRKKLDNFLYYLFPNFWIPLYQSVTFTNIPYSLCMKNKDWQDTVLKNSFCTLGIMVFGMITFFVTHKYYY